MGAMIEQGDESSGGVPERPEWWATLARVLLVLGPFALLAALFVVQRWISR